MVKSENIKDEIIEHLTNIPQELKQYRNLFNKNFLITGLEILKQIKLEDILKIIDEKFFLGSAQKLLSFGDKILLENLFIFLSKIDSKTFEEKQLFFKNLGKKFPEKLLIVIKKIDFEEKIYYLSELFNMLLKEKISTKEFFRCCKILENNIYDDIYDFRYKEEYSFLNEEDKVHFQARLLVNEPPKPGKITIASTSKLKLTKEGEIFLKINKKF